MVTKWQDALLSNQYSLTSAQKQLIEAQLDKLKSDIDRNENQNITGIWHSINESIKNVNDLVDAIIPF